MDKLYGDTTNFVKSIFYYIIKIKTDMTKKGSKK